MTKKLPEIGAFSGVCTERRSVLHSNDPENDPSEESPLQVIVHVLPKFFMVLLVFSYLYVDVFKYQ